MQKEECLNFSLNSDRAIPDKEHDILGRNAFAERLAEAIIQYEGKNSLIIGLYGGWGSGKSSVLNMMVKYIWESRAKAKPTIITIIQIIPWMVSGTGQLITQFFAQIADKLQMDTSEGKQEKREKIADQMRKLSEILEPVELIPVPIVKSVVSVLRIAFQFVSKVFKTKNKTVSLNKLKEEISKGLLDSNCRLVVFIDDIDRLTGDEIKMIFQMIKAVADFPNTVYVLAFDYDVVVKVLEEVQKTKGEAYLEKIVQIPYRIPEIPVSSIREYLIPQIKKLRGDRDQTMPENNTDQANAEEARFERVLSLITSYIKTFRDANRLFNVLSLRYPPMRGKVNFTDFLGITAVQVFDPKVYDDIAFNKEIVLGPDGFLRGLLEIDNGQRGEAASEAEQENQMTDTQKYCDKLQQRGEKGRMVQGILKELFPCVYEAYGHKYYYGFEVSNNDRCRIGNPNCFDRYMTLAIPSQEDKAEQD